VFPYSGQQAAPVIYNSVSKQIVPHLRTPVQSIPTETVYWRYIFFISYVSGIIVVSIIAVDCSLISKDGIAVSCVVSL
jgi:hypothetical protein